MARVSEYYNLGLNQGALDFVDVEISSDVPVFIDPSAIRLLDSDWGQECREMLSSFFGEILAALGRGDQARARLLLRRLKEPNETRLGLSVGRSRGRGLGGGSRANDVANALTTSQAIRSGLLQDLEDTVLMVEGIGDDIVSDITTNVIRRQLIGYTQRIAEQYDLPLEEQHVGPLWNDRDKEWQDPLVMIPRADGHPLLLVPKAIVRVDLDYDESEYYRGYLAPLLKDDEISAQSALVQTLKKDGSQRVTTKAIIEKYGFDKLAIVRETTRHPEALDSYRGYKDEHVKPPLDHARFVGTIGVAPTDFSGLLENTVSVPGGGTDATRYHRNVTNLLTAIFYPALTEPKIEREIHDGRKRIDSVFTNVAQSGFFNWVGLHYIAPLVYVECKNYTGEIDNPALDQLSGRFSEQRGRFGILVCRKIENKGLFYDRCRDTARDGRGYILALDDDDLHILVDIANKSLGFAEGEYLQFRPLKEQFDRLLT